MSMFLMDWVEPAAGPSVTRQTALLYEEATAIGSWEVDCGFSANAGDVIVMEAIVNRSSGSGNFIDTMTIGEQSMTRHANQQPGGGAVYLASVFAIELTSAITPTSKVLATWAAGTTGNRWFLRPSRLIGFNGTPHASVAGGGTSAATSTSVTLNIPAGGALMACGVAHTATAQTFTGVTVDFTSPFDTLLSGFATGLSAETPRTLTLTDGVPNNVVRRIAAISYAPA